MSNTHFTQKTKPKGKKKPCSVLGCTTSKSTHPDISFFQLPLESDRRERWLQLIRREDLRNNFKLSHQICELHFHPKQIRAQCTSKNLVRGDWACEPSLRLPLVAYEDKGTQVKRAAAVSRSSQTPPVYNTVTTYSEKYAQTNSSEGRLEAGDTRSADDIGDEDAERQEFHELCDRFLPADLADDVQSLTQKKFIPVKKVNSVRQYRSKISTNLKPPDEKALKENVLSSNKNDDISNATATTTTQSTAKPSSGVTDIYRMLQTYYRIRQKKERLNND